MSTPQHKKCSKCGELKPLSDFYKNSTGKYGRREKCKPCISEYEKLYRAKNVDRLRIKRKEYYESDKEEVLRKQCEYREVNRDELRERDRQYHWKNRDVILEKKRKYRDANVEKIREADRLWRDLNREDVRRGGREYYRNNAALFKTKNYQNQREVRESSKTFAENTRKRWLPEEDAFLLEENGMTMYQKAISLGRTHSACSIRKTTLRKEMNNA